MTDPSHQENEPEFTLQDFKKWMSENAKNSFARGRGSWRVGTPVEANIGIRKLVVRMEATEGSVVELAREFNRNGGIVAGVDGLYSHIDVANGSFVVPSDYVRRRQD